MPTPSGPASSAGPASSSAPAMPSFTGGETVHEPSAPPEYEFDICQDPPHMRAYPKKTIVEGWGNMRKWLKDGELKIPPSMNEQEAMAFYSSTRLQSGRSGLLVDLGSRGNLAGGPWTTNHARECVKHGKRPY